MLVFITAYSSCARNLPLRDSGFFEFKLAQENTPSDFLQESGRNRFGPKFPDDIPEELRTSEAEYGMFHWQIRPALSNPWVADLLQQLPEVLPRPFRSLIERYRYCEFEVGPLMLLANTGQKVFHEFSTWAFGDKNLFPTLHEHSYLQFALPSGGSYDPVCFDMRRGVVDDAPIIQLDHEEILIRRRILVVQDIAPTFTMFMKRAIEGKFSVN